MTWNLSVINFLWGDVGALPAIFRTILKVSLAILFGWFIHEQVLLPWFFAISDSEINILETEFSKASAKLVLPGTPETRVCLISTRKSEQPECSKFELRKYSGPVLAYEIWQAAGTDWKRVQSGQFFDVSQSTWLPISSVEINSSVDAFLRAVEAVAFNAGKTPTQLELCAATRTLLEDSKCKITSDIQQILRGEVAPGEAADPGSLKSQTDGVRLGALFIGVVQFGTLCIFLYAAVECVGLWLRWVSPRDVLYTVVERGGVGFIDVGDEDTLRAAVARFSRSRNRSLGDRLFARVLVAGARRPQRTDLTDNDADLEANQGLIATLESYRNFLQDDAVARQESLEVLSDTMLKLAFMGTVFGISKALYSARGLDTADPLARLLAKSEMYSGIGIGFGATLVGILLSIVAATIRSGLSESWMREIGTAYRLILDYGVPGFRASASMLRKEELALLGPPPPRKQKKRLGILGVIGLLVVIVLAFLLVRFALLELGSTAH
jgi:hypothetical protein